MTTTRSVDLPPRSEPRQVTLSRLRVATAAAALAVAAVALSWCFGDALWFFDHDGDRNDISLLAQFPRPVVVATVLALSLLGAVAAVAGRGRSLVALAVVQAVAFGAFAGDVGVLMVLGYLVALSFPVALVASLVWGARRSRTAARGLVLLLVAGTGALIASGEIDEAALRDLGAGLAEGTRTNLPGHLVVALMVTLGLLWSLLGVRAVREERGACGGCGRPDDGGWLLRWRVPVTLLAAACALPYFLVRLTWLTGAPFGMSDADLEAEPGIRLMGLLLGLAGLGAAVLTIGLLRPWGRVFPRWMPRFGGRAVPVLFPTLTAGVVGAVMAVAGRSMVQAYVTDHLEGGDPEWLYLVLLPLPVWGPALVLAALAYHRHARGACSQCGADDEAVVAVR